MPKNSIIGDGNIYSSARGIPNHSDMRKNNQRIRKQTEELEGPIKRNLDNELSQNDQIRTSLPTAEKFQNNNITMNNPLGGICHKINGMISA